MKCCLLSRLDLYVAGRCSWTFLGPRSYFGKPWLTSVGLCRETAVSLFFSAYFCFTPRAANSESLLLPANLRTYSHGLCFFIPRLLLQLAHSNCYHTTDGKFHLGFLLLTNGWFVDVFFPPLLQSISLCGPRTLCTQSRLCRNNRTC